MSARESDKWMWAQACQLLEQAERLHRQFFNIATSTVRLVWEPPMDMFESDGEILVLVALPGVLPEQIEVVLNGGVLIVAGVRSLPVEAQWTTIRRLEIPHGRFERSIELPPGVFELQRHELQYGCLVVSLLRLG